MKFRIKNLEGSLKIISFLHEEIEDIGCRLPKWEQGLSLIAIH